ncbi:hypothetical protein [Devosia sp. 2618]|uniref:hypothetical protein n=1 Tax=Devosia sp. 2618 TaxID=3156454 RepID=UPI00339B268A
MSNTKRDTPVEAIDQFDIAYSILHVVLMALEADDVGHELALLQMRETLSAAIEMLVPVRTAINTAGSMPIQAVA